MCLLKLKKDPCRIKFRPFISGIDQRTEWSASHKSGVGDCDLGLRIKDFRLKFRIPSLSSFEDMLSGN